MNMDTDQATQPPEDTHGPVAAPAPEAQADPARASVTTLAASLAALEVGDNIPSHTRPTLSRMATILQQMGGVTIGVHGAIDSMASPFAAGLQLMSTNASMMAEMQSTLAPLAPLAGLPAAVDGLGTQFADHRAAIAPVLTAMETVALNVVALKKGQVELEKGQAVLTTENRRLRSVIAKQSAAFTAIGDAYPNLKVACLAAAAPGGPGHDDMDEDDILAEGGIYDASERVLIYHPFRKPPSGMDWRLNSKNRWNLFHVKESAWKSGYEAAETVPRSYALLAAHAQLDAINGDVSDGGRTDDDAALEVEVDLNRSFDDIVRHDAEAKQRYSGFHAPDGYTITWTNPQMGWCVSPAGVSEVQSVPFRILHGGSDSHVVIVLADTQPPRQKRGKHGDNGQGSHGGGGGRGKGAGAKNGGGGRGRGRGAASGLSVQGGVQKAITWTKRPGHLSDGDKWCAFHASSTHNTADCRSAQAANADKSTKPAN